MELSPDGKTAVSASDDHTARLWDVATGGCCTRCRTMAKSGLRPSAPTARPWRPPALDHTARLWETATGGPGARSCGTTTGSAAVAFSPDGKRLLTASWDHTARLWDVATGRPLGRPFRHEGRVNSVAFSPDGLTVLTAGADRTARLWDARPGQPLYRELPLPGSINVAAYSPERQASSAGHQRRRGLAVRRRERTAAGRTSYQHGEPVTALAWSPDGKLCDGRRTKRQSPVVGCRHRSAAGRSGQVRGASDSQPPSAPTEDGPGRQPRWDRAALRRAYRPDLAACPCSTRKPSSPARSAPTARPPPRPVSTAPSGSGTRPRGNPSVSPWCIRSGSDGAGIQPRRPDDSDRVHGQPGPALERRPPARPLVSRCCTRGEWWRSAFSPDGKTIVTGSVEGRARLWDAATGLPRGQPLLHRPRSRGGLQPGWPPCADRQPRRHRKAVGPQYRAARRPAPATSPQARRRSFRGSEHRVFRRRQRGADQL